MIMTLRKCGEKMSEKLSVAKDIKALALINIQDIFRFTITATDEEIEDRYGSEARAIEVAEKYLEIAMRTSVLEYDLNGWSMKYSVPIKDKNERIEKTAYFYDEADRKTEPTISKMEQVDEPQTKCHRDEEYACHLYPNEGACNNCKLWYEDEPQTDVINPQEPTNDDKCFECDDFITCGGQCNKIEDEPKNEYPCEFCRNSNLQKCEECKDFGSNYEPQTDCAWR
jgi:hypothetical protein